MANFREIPFLVQESHFVGECQRKNFDGLFYIFEIFVQDTVKLFYTVIYAQNLDFSLELCLDHRMEIYKHDSSNKLFF